MKRFPLFLNCAPDGACSLRLWQLLLHSRHSKTELSGWQLKFHNHRIVIGVMISRVDILYILAGDVVRHDKTVQYKLLFVGIYSKYFQFF